MSIFSICKHTVHESFESGNRKPTDNVTEIHRGYSNVFVEYGFYFIE